MHYGIDTRCRPQDTPGEMGGTIGVSYAFTVAVSCKYKVLHLK